MKFLSFKISTRGCGRQNHRTRLLFHRRRNRERERERKGENEQSVRNEKGETTDLEIHRTRMYFLPMRSRLNCSAACLLYLPASQPRVHIDVRCARARARTRYSSASVAPPSLRPCICVCICAPGLVSLASSSSSSSSLSLLLLLFGDFRIASDRKVRSPPSPTA